MKPILQMLIMLITLSFLSIAGSITSNIPPAQTRQDTTQASKDTTATTPDTLSSPYKKIMYNWVGKPAKRLYTNPF